MIITIDGPAASGKSTAAQLLADKLGFCHINSGLLFRAVAYLLATYSGYDAASIAHPKTDDIINYLSPSRFKYICTGRTTAILFDGQDITHFLQDFNVGNLASIASTDRYIRQELLTLQRTIADDRDCVVDGRDTGSVVFPHAQLKFFLTASLEERAQRWLHDKKRLGDMFTLDQAKEKISVRDKRDTERAQAPLIVPIDAHLIDNSGLTREQTVDLLYALVEERIRNSKEETD